MITASCAAQAPRWYSISYKANFTDSVKFAKAIRYQGTLLTPTAAEFNKLHGLTTTLTELGYVHGLTGPVQGLIDAKQTTLVSGTTLKTVGGISLLGSGDIPTSGTGTVTSVAVATANGVSASVANPTSAPNITFTLGAITPTSVNSVVFSGASTPTLLVTGTSAITGTNTGDNAVNSLYSGIVTNQTHSGDAVGSTSLTIQPGVVTLAKMANMATSSLIYRRTAGTGVPEVNTLAQLKTDLGLAGTNTGDQTSITGNAATATKWLTGRYINGVLVDGTADATIPSNIAPGTSGNIMQSTGTVWSSVTPSAELDLSLAIPALTGVAIPRLSTTAINAISSPAEGLLVYDITLHVMKFYNGSTWKIITTN
jgi:hypothetical protein